MCNLYIKQYVVNTNDSHILYDSCMWVLYLSAWEWSIYWLLRSLRKPDLVKIGMISVRDISIIRHCCQKTFFWICMTCHNPDCSYSKRISGAPCDQWMLMICRCVGQIIPRSQLSEGTFSCNLAHFVLTKHWLGFGDLCPDHRLVLSELSKVERLSSVEWSQAERRLKVFAILSSFKCACATT